MDGQDLNAADFPDRTGAFSRGYMSMLAGTCCCSLCTWCIFDNPNADLLPLEVEILSMTKQQYTYLHNLLQFRTTL